MRPRWVMLNEREQAAFRATIAFLEGRLEERAAIDWALSLSVNDTIKRLALLELLESRNGRKICEPWQTAWGIIEESIKNPIIEEHASVREYHLQDRIKAGDLSGALIAEIVDLVAPRLKVEPFSSVHLHYRNRPKRPKSISDLFSVDITSGKLADLSVLRIDRMDSGPFLLSLAYALDAAIIKGLDIARRIRTDKEYRYWHFGGVYRVYYVHSTDGGRDQDEFHQGIAPATKLLHSVVTRLLELDIPSVKEFVNRLKLIDSPIHLRLWASLSENPKVTSAEDVGEFLIGLNSRVFWDLHDYPEISELRAKRFSEFSDRVQSLLTARIRKYPSRTQLKWATDTVQVSKIQVYWAIRELRRIEVAGATLPDKCKDWMNSNIGEFPELINMTRLDEGFLESSKVFGWISPNPDSRFDQLKGSNRLKSIDDALKSGRRNWEDDPPQRASDWIRGSGNCQKIIEDFESTRDGGAAHANVWEAFGWAHSPSIKPEDTIERDLKNECSRVLSLLVKLPEATIREAIEGISHWLSSWERFVVEQSDGLSVWLKIWPLAVEATNKKQPDRDEYDLDSVVQASGEQEPMDLDTLNTPVGKLVSVFLVACPSVRPGEEPFSEENSQRSMRNEIEAALGSSGSIVKYRLIEHLPYFIAADKAWALRYLVPPLLNDSNEARLLWRAVARQRLSFEVMVILGDAMANCAVDIRLNRETRKSFVFRIVVDCLHAFKDKRDPAVSHPRIQQMIRSLDDEVRAHAAEAIQRFVRDLSSQNEDVPVETTPELLFQVAAAPFLRQVWPQERSLSTPGVSKALADLPATAKDAFAEAVDTIERFLVPFNCWSMNDYGLYGEIDGEEKLLFINNPNKAAAFLKLLDLTIGTAEGAIIPHDLANALERIRSEAPNLVDQQAFRRLATAARRV